MEAPSSSDPTELRGGQRCHGRGTDKSSLGAAPWLRDEALVPSNTEREARAGGQGLVPRILDGKREGTKSDSGAGLHPVRALGGDGGMHPGLCSWGHRGGASVLWLQPWGGVAPPDAFTPHTLRWGQLQHLPLRRTADRGPFCVWSQSRQQAQRTTGHRPWLEEKAGARGGEPGHNRCTQVCFQTGRSLSLCVCITTVGA